MRDFLFHQINSTDIPKSFKQDLVFLSKFFFETYSPSLHIPTITMAGEQPIRSRRSITLGHDDRTLSLLARTRYSSPGSSSTAASSATLVTPVIRSITSLSLGHCLGYVDELSHFTVLPPLPRYRAIWPETNRLNSNLMKIPYRSLFGVFCGNWLPNTNVTVVLKERVHLRYAFVTKKRINICIALDPLVMLKVVAPGLGPPSPTPSTPGHTSLGRSTSTRVTSPSPPAPRVESSEVTTSLDLLKSATFNYYGICSSNAVRLAKSQDKLPEYSFRSKEGVSSYRFYL
ncbi:hypothetical protein M9H77_06728 [Catharanthus roseus]|uniref:Uncharacterized protein n=1 Tax=Catharanthus roseus TaxID=4058 RepID=A0ACC0BTA9_CATRO|nr:hypothetical protein M9H77_06728 [Catharanthus roseus]